MNIDYGLGQTNIDTETGMRCRMKAKPWPNKLGWDVRVRSGIAEVRDCVKFLRCFVPVGKFRYRRMDFPIGTDPIHCVEATRSYGVIYDE